MEFIPKVVNFNINNDILKYNIVNEERTIDFSKVKITIGDKHNNDTYYHFCKFIEHIISCDCRAVTVSNEILFNFYNTNNTLLDTIYSQVIRDQLIKDIHNNLFVHFFNSNNPRTMKIYMFPELSCWSYTIQYNPEANALTIHV